MIVFNRYVLIFLLSVTVGNASKSSLQEVWWGPTHLKDISDSRIRSFKVEFGREVIKDLKQRLLNHRPVTPPLEGVGFDYGFNTNCLDSWVNYWANDYDFDDRESFLNQFPQFKTNVQGLDIHFLWVKPDVPPHVDVVPLLFLHGWPGTVRELYEAIPYLIAGNSDRDFALEVIAPSLPGFAYSDAAVRPGLGVMEIAVVIRNLMKRLGFHKFYIQGGDWGSGVGSNIATMYPEEVLGFHSNFTISTSPISLALWLAGSFDQDAIVDSAVKERLYPIKDKVLALIRESGYFHLQATKPDSLGVAMSDSPAGLLAYLLQLMSTGTSRRNVFARNGGLDQYSRDDLLDIITIIWTTNSFTTCSRIYAESINLKRFNSSLETKRTPVPTWTVHAKDEIFYQTPLMLKFKYPNLLQSTILDDGGHFLAFKRPAVFSQDVLTAIAAFRRWRELNTLHKDEL